MSLRLKRVLIFISVLSLSMLVGYRIQKIRREGIRTVHNISRIHAARGAPKEYVVAHETTDTLSEPLYVQNGRALVSIGRIRKFSVGMRADGTSARIESISKNIDLDSGMFVLQFSERITGNFMVGREYTGFFLPLDARVPPNARVIAKDGMRMVVSGLEDGDKVQVK